MDREQEEMQFLGLFGIYKESCKVIYSYWKIFAKITLCLILPLSFIYLAHIEVSNLLLSKIMFTELRRDFTPVGTSRYHRLSDLLSKEWTYFILFKVVYFTFYLILSLLSTSAVVYTVACIFTGRDLTFRKVMTVVPKVWKRLMITFLCIFIATVAYSMVATLVFVSIDYFLGGTAATVPLLIIFLILYTVGFIYLSVVWYLACVVSVLEESYGLKAMMKSRQLIRGKLIIAMVIFFMLILSFLLVQYAFQMLVVYGRWGLVPMVDRVSYAILCFLVLSMLNLFGLVIQTVIYFVCKSYHHENIDKMELSNHLEVYLLAEYVPLKGKDVQLEEYRV
ncbi:hypothetical protein SLEP1_g59740 [Rubroshorea leprosula]|uniref:Uncharacterized protein n=1 Tax=Rubroshorea leprosula TaxID=152421 RepID=A0AAV5MT77_9ROSI|nr:hypothetical protein SLEP1_g59740 [Rubroshorea leprosula]